MVNSPTVQPVPFGYSYGDMYGVTTDDSTSTATPNDDSASTATISRSKTDFEYSSEILTNKRKSPPANAFTNSSGFLNLLQNVNAAIGMGNRNEDSDDDEDGTTPTKHDRIDVLHKLKDNKRRNMERCLCCLSASQTHTILFEDTK